MISVILPSIRPRNCKIIIDRFLKSQQGADFELIVVADFMPNKWKEPVRWFYEPERKGVVNAIALAYTIARGEYIFLINDMAELTPGGLKIMEAFSRMNGDSIIVNQHTVPSTPLEYYGHVFAPYPFVHRSLIKRIGGYFDTIYKGFYSDPDFSLRAYEANVPIVKIYNVTVTRRSPQRFMGLRLNYNGHKEMISKYFEADRETFKKRWAHLGEFKEPK